MRQGTNKTTWLKLAFLAVLICFVAARLDFGDRIVVPESTQRLGSPPAPPPAQLSTPSGRIVTLSPGESFRVERSVSEDPAAVWITAQDERVQIPPDLLEPRGPLSVRPGLRSALEAIRPGLLLATLLVYAPVNVLLGLRWALLLAASDVTLRLKTVLRLTWIGLFFSNIIPGGVGGDVIKLIELGRHSNKQSEALGTMIADRAIGLIVLVGLGLAASFALGVHGDFILSAAGLCTVGLLLALLYTSRWLRQHIDIPGILQRLPLGVQLARLDAALMLLRRRPLMLIGATLLAILSQLLAIVVALLVAKSLTIDEATLLEMLQIVPIAFAANAIPLSPGGLGLMEVAFQELMYSRELSSLAEGFTVGLILRSIIISWSLPGLILWLGRPTRHSVDLADRQPAPRRPATEPKVLP